MAWSEVEELLQEALQSGIGSAMELGVWSAGSCRFRWAGGWTSRWESRAPFQSGIYWDLASLTKPLVGSVLASRLCELGVLTWTDSARRFLDWAPEDIEVQHLLTHSSGLPAWAPLYELEPPAGCCPRAWRLRRAAAFPRVSQAGEAHCYSDLGFMVLCSLLERVGSCRLDELWRELVTEPGGWEELIWSPSPALPTVATELCPVRGRVQGEVHDLNTWALEGVSTHAGLFGTLSGLAAALQSLLSSAAGEGPWPGAKIRESWQWSQGAGSHALGWDRPSAPSSSGRHFPPDAVGHLGFTGTSFWMIPAREILVIFLTNRVHPSAEDQRIRQLRPRLHDAVVEALQREGAWL